MSEVVPQEPDRKSTQFEWFSKIMGVSSPSLERLNGIFLSDHYYLEGVQLANSFL